MSEEYARAPFGAQAEAVQRSREFEPRRLAEQDGSHWLRFLSPLAKELQTPLDIRPLRTLVQTVEALVAFRDSTHGLLLSELGSHLGWDRVRKAGKSGARGMLRGAVEESGSTDAPQTGLLSSAWRFPDSGSPLPAGSCAQRGSTSEPEGVRQTHPSASRPPFSAPVASLAALFRAASPAEAQQSGKTSASWQSLPAF
jgi:hypothetical protein